MARVAIDILGISELKWTGKGEFDSRKHYLYYCGHIYIYICMLVIQSCLTLCDPMDCSPPSSSVHGILQARILEWVAISFSRGSLQPRDRTQVSHIAGGFFTVWATKEAAFKRNGVALRVNRRVQSAVLGCDLKNDRMILVHFQGKPFNITVIQVYAPNSNAEEAEVEQFYEDLQDLLELTSKKDVLFITGYVIQK